MENDRITTAIAVGFWLIGPAIGFWIAGRRGLSRLLGLLCGAMGCAGWVVLLALPAVNPPTPKSQGAGRSFSVDENPTLGGRS